MKILIAGAGPIGVEYAKIVGALGHEALAVGRGQATCDAFTAATGLPCAPGGVEAFMESGQAPSHAIVAVGEAQLGRAAEALIRGGVKHLLIEKPGGANAAEIRALAVLSAEAGAQVYIGYNRRFHASTRRAREIIAEDGGVSSFTFEFTEWSHRIEPLEKEPGVKEQWFLHNSSHVVDLAFHLGGDPVETASFTAGSLAWHPHARYAGAGRTENGAVFAYHADWAAPGRWWVEVLTSKRRLVFRPLEKLQVQLLGSVAVEPEPIEDELDVAFKPGFYLQTKAFLDLPDQLLTIAEQADRLKLFEQIHPGL